MENLQTQGISLPRLRSAPYECRAIRREEVESALGSVIGIGYAREYAKEEAMGGCDPRHRNWRAGSVDLHITTKVWKRTSGAGCDRKAFDASFEEVRRP